MRGHLVRRVVEATELGRFPCPWCGRELIANVTANLADGGPFWAHGLASEADRPCAEFVRATPDEILAAVRDGALA